MQLTLCHFLNCHTGTTQVPNILYNECIPQKEFFMYTTEQFEKDVQGLRDLIKMCDDLEKENDKRADALIKQINGENAFYWRAN